MSSKLTESEITRSLRDLPGWDFKEENLIKRFSFKAYMDGIRFVEMVAIDAEARDHHPDLLVKHDDVTVFLSTHSAGGITLRDLDSAKSIDATATLILTD